MKTALITGVNGQDGSYLAEFLLGQGYRVVGTTPGQNADNMLHIREKIEILDPPLDQEGIEKIVRKYEPDEVYNLAARASSKQLWSDPVATGELNAIAVVKLLDVIHRMDCGIRFLQASSSEIFGNASVAPQNESTQIQPRNPYGVAKAFAHWMTSAYREQLGLFGCSCILYNHESPRRGKELVSRKISHGVAKIKRGLAKELRLGDLNARRDWGFAGDYVRAMWLALQQPAPGDYILATGRTHSVREFCEKAFSHVGLRYQDYVIEDRENLRAPDTVLLMGDPGKAHRVLGWTPTVTFEELVAMMVDADLKLLDVNPGQNRLSTQAQAPALPELARSLKETK
jgi:GDPmannose 4,6-dehydratase